MALITTITTMGSVVSPVTSVPAPAAVIRPMPAPGVRPVTPGVIIAVIPPYRRGRDIKVFTGNNWRAHRLGVSRGRRGGLCR